MDIKVKGISAETMQRALNQARDGRLHILGEIAKCMSVPRAEINPRAPRLHQMTVASDFVGKIIGPGGKTIRGIQDQTGATVEIDDSTGVGVVTICAPNGETLAAAIEMIEKLTEVAEVGKVYEGRVSGIREFGAFVEILPGTEGMCHISELSDTRVETTEDVVKMGDLVRVKVIEVDAMGKVRLSRKAVILEDRGETYTAAPRRAGPPRDRDRGDRDRDRRPRR